MAKAFAQATDRGRSPGERSVALAQELIRFDSVNPPGNEAACVAHIAEILRDAGLQVETHAFAPDRPSLIATVTGEDSALAPLCFAGHVDVVPLGAAPWSVPPFEARVIDGRLYGRGSSDMKAGVAAYIVAVLDFLSRNGRPRRGVSLIVAAGEETGCEGSLHLARTGCLPEAALLVVAEPTSNLPIIAHKGRLLLRVTAEGRTAHSAMPDLGENAIDAIGAMIGRIRDHDFRTDAHPLLGTTTACITTVQGGLNINSVPDRASFTIDFRTLASRDHRALLHEVRGIVGDAAAIEVISDLPGFATAANEPALAPLIDILRDAHGTSPQLGGAPYFTDASALVPGMHGVPTVVIGPGEPEQCHCTDEFCRVDRIEQATEIYAALLDSLCGRSPA